MRMTEAEYAGYLARRGVPGAANTADVSSPPFRLPVIHIKLPGVPAGKGRPRFSRRTGHAYTPEKTRSYESMLQGAAIEAMAGRPPIEGPVRVSIEAHFPVPVSWSKKKQAEALAGDIRPGRPDWDNLGKMLDAFNEVVWRDDSQVAAGSISKFYSLTARLEVTIEGMARWSTKEK
jgi:Holliday junction resolvase RusA-like endonuclease